MTDYDWSIGTGGTMRIRVLTTTVEFWITSNNSTTFAYDMPWGYTVNGVTDNTNEYRYEANSGWERLGAWTVTTDQTVTFRLYDTGTGALGSGETHSVAVDRTSAPPTPPAWAIEQIKDTSVQGDVDGAGTGVLALDQFQVRYDNNSDASSPSYLSDTNLDGYFWITGLARNTTYYFWVRTHNSKGWSPWSARTSAKTHDFPAAPSQVVLSDVKQTTLTATFTSNADGGSPITSNELGYGTNSSAPTTIITSDKSENLTGLIPGVKYYFWARSLNVYGASAWSPVASATMLAGVRVRYLGVWKTAVPYVRSGGVWKVSKPYAKIGGLWKETG